MAIQNFQTFDRHLTAEIDRRIDGTLGDVADEIRIEINKINKTFFKVLASKIIDRTRPPLLKEFRPHWEPLRYREWKIRRGYSPNFYMKTGDLGRELPLVPASVLGDAVVTYSEGQAASGDVSVRPAAVRGRIIGRDARGRFASASRIYKPEIPASLTIFPVSAVPEDDAESILGVGTSIYHKLRNPFGRREREILGPFASWWVNYKVVDAVRRLLSS